MHPTMEADWGSECVVGPKLESNGEGGIRKNLESLANFCATIRVIYDAVKESQHIHEIKPKPAVHASGIKTFRDRRIMPFDQHKPVASKTFHNTLCSALPDSF